VSYRSLAEIFCTFFEYSWYFSVSFSYYDTKYIFCYTFTAITINSTSAHFGEQFVRPPTEPRDLLLLMDGSGSIGSGPFAKALEDLSELIEMLCPLNDPLDPMENPNDHIKLSVILFSTNSDIVFNFNKYQKVSNAQQAIRQIAYKGGSTCTRRALTLGKTLFTIANGNYQYYISLLYNGKTKNKKGCLNRSYWDTG